MIFNTHDRTPRTRSKRSLRLMLGFCWGLFLSFFVFFAIVTSIHVQNLAPALIILPPWAVIVCFYAITFLDMGKAYVSVSENTIVVVDYLFFIRRERRFSRQDIATMEILPGYSLRIRGLRHNLVGFSYLVFYSREKKYLFKVASFPNTKAFFETYLTVESPNEAQKSLTN